MDAELETQRPFFLRVIGLLSVINGIYGLISALVNALAPPAVDDRLMDEVLVRLDALHVPFDHLREDIQEYFMNTMMQINNIAAASFLFYGLSVMGAFFMLRLRRKGFIMYSIGQVGLAVVPPLFGGLNAIGWASLFVMGIWNAIWILMYASQLKHME